MGTYIDSAFREGDLAGTRDVGFTAWTIRWQTAGWAERDNLDVWVHTGVIIDYLGMNGDWYLADMYGLRPNSAFGVFPIDHYMNGPSGNPSVNDLRRSRAISGNPAVQLWLRSLVTSMKNGSYGYDWGGLFGSLFGPRTWNSNTSYLCTEMTWHLICSAERAAGYRKTYNNQPFWPVSNPGYGYNSTNRGYGNRDWNWGIMWNASQIWERTKPWNMKRSCAAGVTWVYRNQLIY